MAESTAGRVADRILGGFESAHGPHDITETDPPPLARQTIAAARTADPEWDLVPDQPLRHRLDGATLQSFTLDNLRRTDRPLAASLCCLWHCRDRQRQL